MHGLETTEEYQKLDLHAVPFFSSLSIQCVKCLQFSMYNNVTNNRKQIMFFFSFFILITQKDLIRQK